jgi:hypothetical protein
VLLCTVSSASDRAFIDICKSYNLAMKFNWGKIRETFIRGDMPLNHLSREITGRADSPTIASIYKKSAPGAENWESLRITYRQQLIPVYPIVPTPVSLPGAIAGTAPINEHGEVLGLPNAIYEEHYSEYLPQRIRDRINKVIGNPEILSMHQDIAVVNALLGDVSAQMDTGESGALWRKLRVMHSELKKAKTAAVIARKAGDSDEEKRQNAIAADRINEILAAIEAGAAASDARDELGRWQLHKKTLIDAEIKRLLHLQAFVRIEDFARFSQVVMDAVTRHEKDPDILYAISLDIEQACAQQRTETIENTEARAG